MLDYDDPEIEAQWFAVRRKEVAEYLGREGVLAYYTDCVRPCAGGGASMIYVAVVMWGSLSAAIGIALTGPVLRIFGVSVNEG